MGMSSVFKEAIVLLFVIELIRFHIFIMDSMFNMLIMVLEDVFYFVCHGLMFFGISVVCVAWMHLELFSLGIFALRRYYF